MQAEAFAETFASAQDCNCDVAVTAEASVWADIWVEATANAYAEGCVGARRQLLTYITAFTSTGSRPRTPLHANPCLTAVTGGGGVAFRGEVHFLLPVEPARVRE